MRTGIALGSNVGDRLANFREAKRRVAALPRISDIRPSSVYETAAVECEPGASEFLNAVLDLEYDGAPADLLGALRDIERQLGRPNEHPRNASRTIDLDLLYFGDMQLNDSHLHLPHPRMLTRRFVLEPLAEIRPDLVLPNQTQPVSALLARLPRIPAVVRLTTKW